MARAGGYGRGGGGRGAGGSGGDPLSQILDDLDWEMVFCWEAYKGTLIGEWEMFAGNEGQITIVQNHILPATYDHLKEANEEWPWSGDADSWLQTFWESYDQEVLERAFSGTAYEIYDTIGALWQEADGFQQEHDHVLGHSAVHSLHPPWVG